MGLKVYFYREWIERVKLKVVGEFWMVDGDLDKVGRVKLGRGKWYNYYNLMMNVSKREVENEIVIVKVEKWLLLYFVF